MRLPARLKTEDIAGKIVRTEIIRHAENLLLVVLTAAAVEHAEPPFRNVGASAGEHIVLGHDVGYLLSLKHIGSARS